MKRFITGLLVAIILVFTVTGCGSNGGSEVENQVLTIKQAEQIAGPIVYTKNIAIVKDSNKTIKISYNSSVKSQKVNFDLTEQLTLIQMIFSGTSEKVAVFDNEEYKWVESYGDRKIGHSYTYFVNSYREGFNVGLPILSGKKTVVMEKEINTISISLNLVESPLYSVEIDLQDRDIVLIDNENFNISKNGTVTLEMSMFSIVKFETDMGDVIEWQLTPLKVLKKLANRSGYQLEETIHDPGYDISLGEFKISKKREYSTKFNEGMFQEFGQTSVSFSVVINEEGYRMLFNSNASDISLYVFDKHGNEKFHDVYDELVVGDIVRVYYTNSEVLDFQLVFEQDETVQEETLELPYPEEENKSDDNEINLCVLLGHCEEGGNLPQPSKDDQDEVELPKV